MRPGGCFSLFGRTLLSLGLVFAAGGLAAQDVWSTPAFSSDPEALRRAATEIKPNKDSEATILLSEFTVSIDSKGRMLKKRHLIYRIETQDAVEGWADVRGNWEPWHQAKPEIKARVITTDGIVHVLDPKTLNDVPVHENTPDLYSDERAYGGPLPALAPGAIAEEEVITQDTSVFFSAGTSETFVLARGVPVRKTRIVLSHPESVPVHYVLHLLNDAVVNKSTTNGVETIVIEKGPLEAYPDDPPYAPPEAVLRPMLEFTTGSSWQQVASTYSELVNQKLRTSDVQPLLSKLDLKTGLNLDSIRKIVTALHKNVRYTGVEFGESSLIPQFPGETLKRRYGDCKDKATLLIAMLRAAGISAHLALLTAGQGEDINPEMPGMGEFDHAIVYVPATTSSPELWIDATAEYSRVGDLPDGDYGRWALIADEKTSALQKIPELTSEKNRHVETREFTLADFGPARIVEKNEQSGPTDSNYRDYYDGDPKKIRENSEKYIKDAYLADSLTAMEKTDPADLDKPFVLTFTAKGRRGFTEIDNAQVYIPDASIFDGLPKYFFAKEENKDESDETASKPRTVDWVITPFITEWHYKITAPAGFKIRALPVNKVEQLGSTQFSQNYSSDKNGTVVDAVLRFDTGKARLTVNEAQVMRDAIVKARAGDGITITFDQIGVSLLSAGKIKDALAFDRQLVADHPREALHRVRLARALLTAGLGEKARTVAKEAVALDPKSAQVFGQQGWILQNDLIGRLRRKGMDYDGAVAAYRKAKLLDPKDRAVRADLAMLLEHDADGVRYSKQAHLEEAITEFNELKKLDEDYARSYEDFPLYDLWYLGKFKETGDYAAGLRGNDVHKAFVLGGIAATDGSEAAIKKSLEICSDEQERSKALSSAGRLMLRVRRYSDAADLLIAGARGQDNAGQIARLATMLKRTQRREESKVDAASPSSVIQNLFGLMFSGKLDPDKIVALTAKSVAESSHFKDENSSKKLAQTTFELRDVAEKGGMPLESLGDLALSNAHYSSEGDDTLGYKIAVETPGAPANEAFVVREAGQYKLVEISTSAQAPENLAWEILARWRRNDLTGARKWLDWAREEVHINTGDDPLSGLPFPHFWTKGQAGDEHAIHLAALVLLPSRDLKGEDLAALIEARNQAQTDTVRTDLNLVLAHAYSQQKRWTELKGVAEDLMKASPDSFTAFLLAAKAYAELKEFDTWERLLATQLQKHPDDPDYIRSAASLARYRGQFDKSRELLKGVIDHGKSTSSDLNAYAWDALFVAGKVDQEAIDAAHRASELTKNSNFDILHTLACLYAATDKTKEARELLLKAMEAAEMDEPDSAVWLALASIAEQYGETDAARTMYGRVEKPEVDSPNSNYVLAQQRLVALQNATAAAKAAGQ